MNFDSGAYQFLVFWRVASSNLLSSTSYVLSSIKEWLNVDATVRPPCCGQRKHEKVVSPKKEFIYILYPLTTQVVVWKNSQDLYLLKESMLPSKVNWLPRQDLILLFLKRFSKLRVIGLQNRKSYILLVLFVRSKHKHLVFCKLITLYWFNDLVEPLWSYLWLHVRNKVDKTLCICFCLVLGKQQYRTCSVFTNYS